MTCTLPSDCAEGCTCASGLVFNGTHCVEPSDCPCLYHSNYYRAGETWRDGCNRCICWNNTVICNPIQCPTITYCPTHNYTIIRKDCCDVCVPACNDSQFYCHIDKTCIPRVWSCDGMRDCSNNEDESNCTKISSCNDTLGNTLLLKSFSYKARITVIFAVNFTRVTDVYFDCRNCPWLSRFELEDDFKR